MSEITLNGIGKTSAPFEAGVVFGDQPNFLCLPLSRFGITNSDEVLSVRSSCECTRVSIVKYRDTAYGTGSGLRIDFVPEVSVSSSAFVPAELAIDVTFEFVDGRSTIASIHFLHTQRADALH